MKIGKEFNHKKLAYKFDELATGTQERLIEDYQENNEDFNDWGSYDIIYQLEEGLKEKGFYDVNICYTGFHSQGDGAMFEYSGIDLDKFLNDEQKKEFDILLKYNDSIRLICKKEGNYCHEYSINKDEELEEYYIIFESEEEQKKANEQFETFIEVLEEWRVKKCKEIYKSIEEEADCFKSEDYTISRLNDELYSKSGVVSEDDINKSEGSLRIEFDLSIIGKSNEEITAIECELLKRFGETDSMTIYDCDKSKLIKEWKFYSLTKEDINFIQHL